MRFFQPKATLVKAMTHKVRTFSHQVSDAVLSWDSVSWNDCGNDWLKATAYEVAYRIADKLWTKAWLV